MRRQALVVLALLFLVPAWDAQAPVRAGLPGTTLDQSNASHAFTAWGAMGNTMAEKDGHLFFVYYTDANSSVPVYVAHRTPAGDWLPPINVGTAYDDHAYPTLAIDSQGYLHVVFGGHVRPGRPIQYRQSAQPLDAASWTAPQVLTTVNGSTYTNLVIDGSDTLYLTYREGGSDDGWLVFRTKPAGQPWSAAATLALQSQWSTYPYDLLVEPGAIHVAFSWRDCRDCEWDRPSYLVSHDSGATWEDGFGNALALPVTRASLAPMATAASTRSMHLNLVQTPGGLRAFFLQGVETADPDGPGPQAGGTSMALWRATPDPGGWSSGVVHESPWAIYKLTYQEGAVQFVTRSQASAAVAQRVFSVDEGATWSSQPLWLDPGAVDAHVYVDKGRSGGDPPSTLRGLAATRPPAGSTSAGIAHFVAPPLLVAAGLPEPWPCGLDCP